MTIRTWAVIGVLATTSAVAAGMAVGRAIWPQPEVATTSAPLSPLYIAEDKLDLGEVWESKDAVLTVPISNRTDRDIEILDFETSCDCGEVFPRKLKVPAKGTADVTVKMDLTRRTVPQIGMVRRKFAIKLKPVLNGIVKTTPIQLSGIARSAVTLNHVNLGFGDSRMDLNCQDTRTLVATTHEPIVSLVVRSSSSMVGAAHRQVNPGTWEIQAKRACAGKRGYWEAIITLECTLSSGASVSIPVPASGRWVDEHGEG